MKGTDRLQIELKTKDAQFFPGLGKQISSGVSEISFDDFEQIEKDPWGAKLIFRRELIIRNLSDEEMIEDGFKEEIQKKSPSKKKPVETTVKKEKRSAK